MLSRRITNLKTLALIEAEKSVTKNLIGVKDKWNGKHEEDDSLLHNTTSHTQHLYQISKSWAKSSWEIFATNFPMYNIGVRDGKMEKEGKN